MVQNDRFSFSKNNVGRFKFAKLREEISPVTKSRLDKYLDPRFNLPHLTNVDQTLAGPVYTDLLVEMEPSDIPQP